MSDGPASVAHLHFKRTRYKAGRQCAAARVQYITGQAKGQIEYSQGAGREDVVCISSGNLPAWAESAQGYFEATEQYERQGGGKHDNKYAGVAFEEWKITLPVELTVEQNKALAEDLLCLIAGDRLPYTYAFHNPQTLDQARAQPHLHVIISARQTDGITRTPAQHFKRHNATSPEHGGAKKDPTMNVYHATKLHRLMIADILNVYLECHGQVARIHPDSLESRDIKRQPEPKLRPSESQAYRERGEVSATMAEVLRIRAAREKSRVLEQGNAQRYWQERKRFLGLERAMPREAQVARIVALRQGTTLPTVPRSQPRQGHERQDTAELDKRWSSPIIANKASMIYHLPTHKNYGDVRPQNQVYFTTEREAQAAGYRRARNAFGVGSDTAMSAEMWARMKHGRGGLLSRSQSSPQSLAAHLDRLSTRLDRATAQGGGGHLRVRLHEEEPEHSW